MKRVMCRFVIYAHSPFSFSTLDLYISVFIFFSFFHHFVQTIVSFIHTIVSFIQTIVSFIQTG